jgi:hypothetical protein
VSEVEMRMFPLVATTPSTDSLVMVIWIIPKARLVDSDPSMRWARVALHVKWTERKPFVECQSALNVASSRPFPRFLGSPPGGPFPVRLWSGHGRLCVPLSSATTGPPFNDRHLHKSNGRGLRRVHGTRMPEIQIQLSQPDCRSDLSFTPRKRRRRPAPCRPRRAGWRPAFRW